MTSAPKKMRMSLIVEDRMIPAPAGVEIIENWGPRPASGKAGNLCTVEAETEKLRSWLKPFETVVVPEGHGKNYKFVAYPVK